MIIRIGNRVFECEPSPLLDGLRIYFDVRDGEWIFNPSKVSDLEKFKDAFSKLIGVDVSDAVDEAIKMKILNLLRAGIFAVPAGKATPPIFRRIGSILYLNVDKVAEFASLDEDALSKYILSVLDSYGIKYWNEHVEWLKNNVKHIVGKIRSGKTVWLIDTSYDVQVLFSRNLTDYEVSQLINAFTIPYYEQDENGNLIPRKLCMLRRYRQRNVYRIPYFAVPKMVRIAKLMGFSNVIDNVRWVSGKIPRPKPNITLYKFQHDALRAWIRNGCRGVVAIPTGGGKTFIGLMALAYLSVPTLICVTTIELARQWLQRLKEHLGIKAGLLGGGRHDIKEVTVAIYNSAVKYVDNLKDKFDLFIADEVHHIPAKTFKEIAFLLKARYRLGLSATPKRFDRNETLIFFSMGDMVYKAKYMELVKYRIVAPLDFYRIYVRLNGEEFEEYLKVREIASKAKIQRMMKIALCASEKYDVLKKLVRKFNNDKIIVFCQYIDQARKAFRAVVEVARGQAVLLTSKTKAHLRKKYFEMFKNGEKRIIVTTTVLDEGVDVPDAETAIIMSGTGSERQLIQRIGRVIRYRHNKLAKVIEIVTKGTIEETLANRRINVLRDYGFRV